MKHSKMAREKKGKHWGVFWRDMMASFAEDTKLMNRTDSCILQAISQVIWACISFPLINS